MNDSRYVLECKRGHLRTPESTLPDGACRTCARERNRQRYKEQGHGPDSKRKCRQWQLKYLYNLTKEAFLGLLTDCKNQCVCGREFGDDPTNTPCVDHDHKCCAGNRSCGKCIRGLLCRQCNLLLGIAEDNPYYLPPFLAEYLTEVR